jgi:GT2 family glycosyltransferase
MEFFEYASYLNDKWSDGALQSSVLETPYLNAGNMMMRKSVFLELGMFDARLRDAEDFELAVKAFDRGMPIYFDRSIQAGHHLQKSFLVYAKRLVEYERARNALRTVNPTAARYIVARRNVSTMKRYLYKAFSWPFIINLIDRGVFRILPKRVRFRIYDFLLTSYSRSNN